MHDISKPPPPPPLDAVAVDRKDGGWGVRVGITPVFYFSEVREGETAEGEVVRRNQSAAVRAGPAARQREIMK